MPRKKYSIHWENEEPVSFEADGVVYKNIDQVPEEADRDRLTGMMDASFDASLDEQIEKEFQDVDNGLA